MPIQRIQLRQDALMANSVSGVVKPWYRQFYVLRGTAAWASDAVSDEGYEMGVEAIGGFIYISTAMYGSPTQVLFEVSPSEPAEPGDAERSAVVAVEGDGPLALLNWGDDKPVATVDVPGGLLWCRVSWTGSVAASRHPDAEVGGTSLSPERVRIQAWPAR